MVLKLFIWIAWLTILLFLCMIQSRKILLTPQFVYVGCFLPQAVFAVGFVKKWDIDLSTETMFILTGGMLLFVGLSFFFSYCLSISYRFKFRKPVLKIGLEREAPEQRSSKEITVERWKLFVFLVFEIGALLLVVYYFMSNIPGTTLTSKILAYNNSNKFGNIDDAIILPIWVNWPRMISSASCYITGYILMNSLVLKIRQHTGLLVACLVVGLINTIIIGTRIEVVGFFIALIIQAYFIWGNSKGWSRRIRIKSVSKVILLGIVILVVFQWSAQFIGRGSNTTFIDYLCIYIAAPLKNLDSFIREGHYGNEISNWETLRVLINDLGKMFNVPQIVHQRDLPFRVFGGKTLGNVYTLFYCYLHDGGYTAVIIFTILEAFVAQLIYKKAIQNKQGINLSIILYSYVLYTIFMGFFSDRFYCSIFTFTMLRRIILWWLLSFFFTKVQITKRGNASFYGKKVKYSESLNS